MILRDLRTFYHLKGDTKHTHDVGADVIKRGSNCDISTTNDGGEGQNSQQSVTEDIKINQKKRPKESRQAKNESTAEH